MKPSFKFLICLILLSVCFILKAQNEDAIFKYGEFKENSVVYIFADNVNIRETASTNAKVIANLSIATQVEIISKSDETYEVNGYNACWYKIGFENNGNKKTGYIWGGFLSAVSFKTTNDSGDKVYFLYAISGFTDEEGFMSTLKAVVDGKIVSSVSFRPEDTEQFKGKYGYDVSGKLIDNKGLENVKKIIMITFLYPACGYNNGDIVVLWTGKKLIYGCESPRVSEAGVFSFSSELIYPTDDGGKPNQIIRKDETITYDEEGNIESTKMKKIKFVWNGVKLVEQKNE